MILCGPSNLRPHSPSTIPPAPHGTPPLYQGSLGWPGGNPGTQSPIPRYAVSYSPLRLCLSTSQAQSSNLHQTPQAGFLQSGQGAAPRYRPSICKAVLKFTKFANTLLGGLGSVERRMVWRSVHLMTLKPS